MKNIKTKDLVMGGIFIALMVVSAKIQIPFPYVPLTFQLVVTIASGIFLGKFLAPLCMVIYIILGLVGLPVFATGGGIGYALSPTFGFIIGFPISAWITGFLWDNKDSKRILAIILGILITYIVGIPWFWIITRFYLGKVYPIQNVLMIPYFLKDIGLGAVIFGLMNVFDRYTNGVENDS